MRILNDLKKILPELSDKDAMFIEQILFVKKTGARLTRREFGCLSDLHRKHYRAIARTLAVHNS